MKHMPLLFIFTMFILAVGCQESTKSSNSSNNGSNNSYYCIQYPSAPECTGSTTGTTGGTTGTYYCDLYPTSSVCTGSGTTGTTGSTTGGTSNPYPFYYSGYVDKNWGILYPYVPSVSCATATTPSGISYTPYETRKGTITLKGQVDYDPSSGQAYFDTTSSLLQSVTKAREFFWGDSTLKVRFKSNIQPSSANTSTVCPGRVTGQSSIKGYGKIKFDLYLVGRKANGSETTISLGTKEVGVNTCTSAIDLSSYAAEYPNGIYLKVKNVYGNQNWLPGTYQESWYYDSYGYVSPQNPYVASAWKLIRNAECWSLDIEVAADGTKTFN